MVAARLARVLALVDGAARSVGRDPESVTVVAVSKGQPVDLMLEAYEAGQRHFGENRAQELARKVPELPGDVSWHMVGHLQRNKVGLVRPLVAMLHSMDSLPLARTWAKGSFTPPVLIEVNLAGEPQKNGIDPDGVGELAGAAVDLGLEVAGLMAIPPFAPDAESSRPWFAALAELSLSLGGTVGPELSMGMSGDFEVAIAHGATMVRVGEAIFGRRER